MSDDWHGILRDDEAILWQGKPDDGFYIHPSRRKTFVVGAFFTAIGLTLLVLGLIVAEIPMILFALFFLAISLTLTLGQSLWPTYKRRHTFYSLTNQRAILGIALPRRKRTLKFFDIQPEATYEFIPGPIGSIVFDHEDQGVKVNNVPQLFAVGFMRFAEAPEVWQMVQDLQRDMRQEKITSRGPQ